MNKKRFLSIVFSIVLVIVFLVEYFATSSSERSLSIRKLDTTKYIIFRVNDSEILMNCFIYCDFANDPCMLRHKQPKYENVVFRGDNLACNFDYSVVSDKNMYNWNISIWFYREYQSLQEDNLNLKEGTQQLTYFLKDSGVYKFELVYLPDIYIGWKRLPFKFEVYAYDSTDDYDSRLVTSNMNDILFFGSIVGIIIGFLSLLVDNDEIRIDSDRYTIRVYKKKVRRRAR